MEDLDDFIKEISPEYASLAPCVRRSLHEFFFLWTVLEAQQLGCNATMKKLKQLSIRIDLRGELATKAMTLYSFFTRRYITDGKLNQRFSKLHFSKNPTEGERVKSFLIGPNEEPSEVLEICLYIIYRVRNNLFHGTKWNGTINPNDQIFEKINALLRMLLLAGKHNPSELN